MLMERSVFGDHPVGMHIKPSPVHLNGDVTDTEVGVFRIDPVDQLPDIRKEVPPSRSPMNDLSSEVIQKLSGNGVGGIAFSQTFQEFFRGDRVFALQLGHPVPSGNTVVVFGFDQPIKLLFAHNDGEVNVPRLIG